MCFRCDSGLDVVSTGGMPVRPIGISLKDIIQDRTMMFASWHHFGQKDDLVMLGPPPTYRRCPPLKKVPHTYGLPKKNISAIVVVDSDEEDFFDLSKLFYLVEGFVNWSVRLSFVQTSYGISFYIGTVTCHLRWGDRPGFHDPR